MIRLKPAETVFTLPDGVCSECGQDITRLRVLQSAAGYYIGTRCGCGPYSRESGYYPTKEAADADLPRFIALQRQLNN